MSPAVSSHLSVNYSTATQPAATTGGAGAPASTDAQGPLGFLSALIDQMTSAASTPAASGLSDLVATVTNGQQSPATPAPGKAQQTPSNLVGALTALLAGAARSSQAGAADANAPAPADSASDAPPAIASIVDEIRANPGAAAALSHLAKALGDVGDSLDAGETPTPEALKKLSDAVDAVLALLVPPQQMPQLPTASTTTLDPLAAIDATAPGTITPNGGAASPMDAGPTIPGATAENTASGADASATGNPALPGIAALAGELDSFSQALRSAAPGIADKLEALGTELKQAASNPTALAALTNAADSDGTKLDALVQTLLKNVSAPASPATAQTASAPIAPPQGLAIPAILTPEGKARPAAPATSADKSSDKPAITLEAAAQTDAAQPADPVPTDTGKSSKDESAGHAAVATAPSADSPTKSTDAAVASVSPNQPPQSPMSATPARLLPAAYQTGATAINMAQIAFEMVHQANKGQSRFTIRLDPAELGRVDVRMHVDAAGTVNAQLTVERTETLDMFQRDKGTLERALSQAGLDSSKTNLEFSLRQNPFAGMAGGDRRPGGQSAGMPRSASTDSTEAAPAVPAVTLYRGVATSGGVNLFA